MENDDSDIDDDSDVDEDNVEQNEFCIGVDPCVVLDQYLGGEELTKLILEGGNVFENDLS